MIVFFAKEGNFSGSSSILLKITKTKKNSFKGIDSSIEPLCHVREVFV